MQTNSQKLIRSLRQLTWQAARVIVILFLLAGATFIPSQKALAAGTYTVDRADDIAPRGTGASCLTTAADNDCTLREAVLKANANPGSKIQFAASLNGIPIVLTRAGSDADANAGDLDINASTEIVGNGASNTIIQGAADASYSGSIGDKVFGVNQDGTFDSLTVHFSGLTVRYGDNTVPASDPWYAFTGGGVDVFQTGLNNVATFTDCVISYNRNHYGYGGGLNIDQGGTSTGYAVDATGSVTLTNVTFDHNQTMAAPGQMTGGALNIFGLAPVVTISNSTFTNNSSPANSSGGAIYHRPTSGGSLSVDNSVFSGNSSGTGGAISTLTYGTGATVSIQNSQFTNNTANNGGGLSLESGAVTTAPFQLTNLLISGNTAGTHGGGVYVGNAKVTLANSRIVNNTATSDAASKGLYKDSSATTVTAASNWWGCSTGPSAAPCDTAFTSGGTLVYSPWFRDQLTAAASPLVTNQSTTLTASFLTNSAGAAVPLANLAQLIGRSVTWGSTLGDLSGTQATVQAAGTATGSFQATGVGTAVIYAKVDNDNTSGASSNVLSLTINKANTTTSITADAPDPSLAGGSITVNYTVSGAFGNSPTAPTGNVTVTDGVNTCTGTVAAGSCNITLTTAGARTLTATYAGDANFNGSASAGESHTVNSLPDLTAVKTNDVAGILDLGGSFNWSILVSNAASMNTAAFTAGQTILTDNLPDGPAYPVNTTITPNGATGAISCPISGNTLTCTAGVAGVTIPSGASFTVSFSVTPAASGFLVNPAGGVCQVDPVGLISEDNEANNGCSDFVTIISQADLALTKTDSPDPALAGNNLTYTINFTNGGPETAQSVVLADTLPAGTTFVSASVTSGSGWSTSAPAVGSAGDVRFSKGAVSTSETAAFQIVVKVSPGVAKNTLLTNTASVSSSTIDPVPGQQLLHDRLLQWTRKPICK